MLPHFTPETPREASGLIVSLRVWAFFRCRHKTMGAPEIAFAGDGPVRLPPIAGRIGFVPLLREQEIQPACRANDAFGLQVLHERSLLLRQRVQVDFVVRVAIQKKLV